MNFTPGEEEVFPGKKEAILPGVFDAFPRRAGLRHRVLRHQQREPLFQGCVESCTHGTACWQGTALTCVTVKARTDLKGGNSCREGSSLSKDSQICAGITQT